MTRQDVLNNVLANYSQYGISKETVEENIRSGEAQGFSYLTIYTGLRMAFSEAYGTEELFTPAELAECYGTSEAEVIKEIEQLRTAAIQNGDNPDKYAYKIEPDKTSGFVLPAGWNK